MSIFNSEPVKRYKRTRFNLNHEVKTTMKFGNITPILCQEVLPGDTWKLQTEQLIRFAPLASPLMHRINAYVHYFFVPNRLLMQDLWGDFISPSGLPDEERPELPYLVFDGVGGMNYTQQSMYCNLCIAAAKTGWLLDHIGFNIQHLDIPTVEGETRAAYWSIPNVWTNSSIKIPLLPLAAYWLIMAEYYLDENQNDIRTLKKELINLCKQGEISLKDYFLQEDASNSFLVSLMQLCRRSFEKDYFTAALPSTQRGGEVTLGGVQQINSAFVRVDGIDTASSRVTAETGTIAEGAPVALASAKNAVGDNLYISTPDGSATQDAVLHGQTVPSNGASEEWRQVSQVNGEPVEINPITINELRRAVKLQEFLEKSMRGGYRLIEQILAHFGVISSDARLDRPEFLGGASNPVTISEVTGTSTTEASFLGEYSGHAQAFGGSRIVKRRFEEHGWIFCLVSVLPRTAYCQGIAKQFQRFDRFDFAWPSFAHLGEQPVWENELYVSPDDQDDPHEVFGYQSRYAEYKYIPSQVSGDFKATLDYWSLVRKFSQKPTLSKQFIECDPLDESNTRAFTIQDDVLQGTDYLYCQFYHKILAKRELPKFGVPML